MTDLPPAEPPASISEPVVLHGEVRNCTREDLAALDSPLVRRMLDRGIQSFCSIPLITRTGTLGTFNLGSLEDNAFAAQDVTFLKQVAAQVAIPAKLQN